MSHRRLKEIISRVRKDKDAAPWSLTEEKGMPVEIRSDKGEATVRAFLAARFENIHIRFVFEVEGMPNHRDYAYRVW